MYFIAHYVMTEKARKIEVLHHPEPDGEAMLFETVADAESVAKEVLNVDYGYEKDGLLETVNLIWKVNYFSIHRIPGEE